MNICGLQKMTLLDFPGKVACTVFLPGCDFRCPFCHNYELAEGRASSVLTEDEFFRFLAGRRGLLDGVAVTGGEPCMSRDLPDFLRNIRALGFPVKLDTNGNHPDMLRRILEEGLADYVAMDVKNSPARYAETAGLPSLDLTKVRESIGLLLSGKIDYEFRTTVVEELHREEDMAAIGELIRGAKRYRIQCFTDRDSVPFEGLHAPSEEKMNRFLDIVRPFVPDSALRGV